MIASQLKHLNVVIATILLTDDKTLRRRQLHYEAPRNWPQDQQTLLEMSSRASVGNDVMAVLAHVGWNVSSPKEVVLCANVDGADTCKECYSVLLSARSGSADVLVELIGQVELDVNIGQLYRRICMEPSDQGEIPTCYAHSAAVVAHMALLRIEGREGGYPSREEITSRLIHEFGADGAYEKDCLAAVTQFYRPLRFKMIDEHTTQQAVVHRPILTSFALSNRNWDAFCNHFENSNTILARANMAPYRKDLLSIDETDTHSVALIGCDSRSLTFLNC